MGDTKATGNDWNKAAASSERSWDKEPGKSRNAPESSIEDAVERTEEGYGSGKEDVDPGKDDSGTTPTNAAG